jgi:serine/threonine protein kinase
VGARLRWWCRVLLSSLSSATQARSASSGLPGPRLTPPPPHYSLPVSPTPLLQPGSSFSEASLCTAEERKHLAAFRNEAQVIWHINDPGHPGVIAMLAFFEAPKPCLVTPFVAGGSLKQYVRAATAGAAAGGAGHKGGGFSFSSASIMASGISEGLAYLHSKGVVHRLVLRRSMDTEPT